MKKVLAASALLMALASPVFAQSAVDRLAPQISDQPDRWPTQGVNPNASTNESGIDYGTTQSVQPDAGLTPGATPDVEQNVPGGGFGPGAESPN